jgi:hypothetical protein
VPLLPAPTRAVNGRVTVLQNNSSRDTSRCRAM